MAMKKILTAAEYTSLGVSVLGTIVAATTGQIACATFPLICSLFLNIINRNKLDRNTSQNITYQISQVENSFTKNSHSLKEQIENLKHALNTKNNSEDIKQDYQQNFIELTQKIETLKNNLTQLNSKNKSNEIVIAIATVEKKLKALEQQFNNIDETINHFIDSKTLDSKTTAAFQEKENQLYDCVQQKIDEFNYFIQDNRPEYQLVFDRRGSRDVLLEALQEAQERIILVCPWITYYGADDQVIKYCQAFLNNGGSIDIGWGHLKDIDKKQHISVSRDEFLGIVKINQKDWVYNQLEKFIELEKQYPNLKLKLLGTHEKFLVCDRSFAMIGSHNFLTSNCHSSERELGLRTNDKNIIEDLIDRFENAPSLDNAENLNCEQNTSKIFAPSPVQSEYRKERFSNNKSETNRYSSKHKKTKPKLKNKSLSRQTRKK